MINDQRFAYRSGKKSRPRTISAAFFSAPTNGTAFSPVSSVPLTTPFRRTVAKIVAAAMTVPRTGIERLSRRDSRAPPHLVNFCPILIRVARCKWHTGLEPS